MPPYNEMIGLGFLLKYCNNKDMCTTHFGYVRFVVHVFVSENWAIYGFSRAMGAFGQMTRGGFGQSIATPKLNKNSR